jgi:hypothetical protein
MTKRDLFCLKTRVLGYLFGSRTSNSKDGNLQPDNADACEHNDRITSRPATDMSNCCTTLSVLQDFQHNL